MAFARFSKGLRRGSTKTETYSTLATRKYGRVQIIKDRVTDIKNPQTNSQMQQRVIFATVTKAAQKMAELIEISRESQKDRNFARQEFITENVAFIRSVAGRRVGTNLHYLAAYAPKGNTQLIPNSYIVSKGSLDLPTITIFGGAIVKPWEVLTLEDKGSFGDPKFEEAVMLGALPFGTYSHAQVWKRIFGLEPGDQLTFPQISGGPERAQSMLDGDDIVDKTIYTQFAAPRLVLKEAFNANDITIDANTTIQNIQDALINDIDFERSFEAVARRIISSLRIDDTADETILFGYDQALSTIVCVKTNDQIRALGTILSRKVNGKWCYSTCQLTCVWDWIGRNSGNDYFGFTLDYAIETYLPSVQTDTNGNFLQRGGESDIVPEQ